MVTVFVELADGSELTKTFPAAQWDSTNGEILGVSFGEVVTCTAIASDGTCETTGPTCAAAVAGTIACLQEMNEDDPEP
ncbi:MAG: hypothetical protein ACI81P_001572 [Neolewinella sp.]|jgi:hypothetical protein